MSNHVSHAELPYPIRGARYSIIVPYLDADGDPTDPTTPDTEISKDNGAFADCAEEAAAASGALGCALITLSGAETDAATLALAAKAASGPKTTLMTLYPRRLAAISSGTLSGGAAGSATLGTILAYDITGCFLKTTGGTGGGGTGGANNQARKITAYNTSTGQATVSPNWETTPDNTTTYDVLLPEGVPLLLFKPLAADFVAAASIATSAANKVRDAVTDDVVETQGSITLQQALSLILAACAGRTSGGTFKTINNGADRLVVSYTGNDRTGVTPTPSS